MQARIIIIAYKIWISLSGFGIWCGIRKKQRGFSAIILQKAHPAIDFSLFGRAMKAEMILSIQAFIPDWNKQWSGDSIKIFKLPNVNLTRKWRFVSKKKACYYFEEITRIVQCMFPQFEILRALSALNKTAPLYEIMKRLSVLHCHLAPLISFFFITNRFSEWIFVSFLFLPRFPESRLTADGDNADKDRVNAASESDTREVPAT